MNKKTIEAIRAYYRLPETVTDDTIKDKLKGSIGETMVDLDFAVKRLGVAFKNALPDMITVFKGFWYKRRL